MITKEKVEGALSMIAEVDEGDEHIDAWIADMRDSTIPYEYSRRTDTALFLIPEYINMRIARQNGFWVVKLINPNEHGKGSDGIAKTLPLAICEAWVYMVKHDV